MSEDVPTALSSKKKMRLRKKVLIGFLAFVVFVAFMTLWGELTNKKIADAGAILACQQYSKALSASADGNVLPADIQTVYKTASTSKNMAILEGARAMAQARDTKASMGAGIGFLSACQAIGQN
jgi:hypothetical protein